MTSRIDVPGEEAAPLSGAVTEVTRASWMATLVAATGMGFDAYVINLPVILVTPVAALYGVSVTHLAAIQTIFLAGYFIGTMAFATAADYLGRKVTLAISIIGYSAAAVITGLAPTLTLFAVGRFVTAVLGGGEQSVGSVYATEAWPDRWRGWGGGNMFTLYPLGVILLILVDLVMVPQVGVRSAFYVAGIIGLILFLFRYHVLESDRFSTTKRLLAANLPTDGEAMTSPPVRRRFSLWEVVRQRSLRRPWLSLLAVNVGDNFTYHGLSVAFVLYLHKVYHLNGVKFLDVLLLLYGTQVVLCLLGSWLIDVVGRRVVGVAISATIIVGIVVMLQMHTLAGFIGVALVTQTIALGPAWCVKLALGAEVFPTEIRASGVAMTLGLGRIAALVSPTVLVALVAAFGIRHVLYIYCGSALLTLLGYLAAPEMRRRPILDLISQLPQPQSRRAAAPEPR